MWSDRTNIALGEKKYFERKTFVFVVYMLTRLGTVQI